MEADPELEARMDAPPKGARPSPGEGLGPPAPAEPSPFIRAVADLATGASSGPMFAIENSGTHTMAALDVDRDVAASSESVGRIVAVRLKNFIDNNRC